MFVACVKCRRTDGKQVQANFLFFCYGFLNLYVMQIQGIFQKISSILASSKGILGLREVPFKQLRNHRWRYFSISPRNQPLPATTGSGESPENCGSTATTEAERSGIKGKNSSSTAVRETVRDPRDCAICGSSYCPDVMPTQAKHGSTLVPGWRRCSSCGYLRTVYGKEPFQRATAEPTFHEQ